MWWPGERKFVQEPVFVPKKGATAEDAGWLLCLVRARSARRSRLAILTHVSRRPALLPARSLLQR